MDKSPKSVKKVFAGGANDGLSSRRCLSKNGIEEFIPIRIETRYEERNIALLIITLLGVDSQAHSL
jgi:hypothetical protein